MQFCCGLCHMFMKDYFDLSNFEKKSADNNKSMKNSSACKNCLISIITLDFRAAQKTMQILITWLYLKSSDLDLHERVCIWVQQNMV